MRFLLLITIAISILNSNEISSNNLSLTNINTIFKSPYKDFLINEYLKSDITKNQASEAISYIDNMNNRILFNFAKKFNHDETKAVVSCMKTDIRNLIDTYPDCIAAGFKIDQLSKLNALEFEKLKQQLLATNKYPNILHSINIISSSIPFTKLVTSNSNTFYDVFMGVDQSFRERYFNYKPPLKTFNKIFKDISNFEKFVKTSVKDSKLSNIHQFLLNIDDTKLSNKTSYYLAINALRLKDTKRAITYLQNSINKTKNQDFKDNLFFMKYYISKDKQILQDLSKSANINFYTYLANEILGKDLNKFYNLYINNSIKNKSEYFGIKRVALLHAISKTKTNFTSSYVSKDFDIGLIGIKLEILENLTNNLNEKQSLHNKIDDIKNINFANIHINSIEKISKNILDLILMFESKNINSIDTSFLDFEAQLNEEESYIKEILLNYVLYFNKLSKNNDMKLSPILKNLFEFDQVLY